MKHKAVVVLSGGLDSSTCMGIAEELGYELHPIFFFYGQKHILEFKSSKKISEYYKANLKEFHIEDFFSQIGGSSLTDNNIRLKRDGMVNSLEIPDTYVPSRNLIFLSFASSYAEKIKAEFIYIGVNALDYSGYPDCRPEFIEKFNEILKVGTKFGTTDLGTSIMAPLINLTKAQIIKEGIRLNVPYEFTLSCYEGTIPACGMCDSCTLRLDGFKLSGHQDPILYRKLDLEENSGI